MSKSKHILIFRLSAMGDVAMTVPVIRALVDQHPEVKVTVVSRPFFKPFFENLPNVSFFGIDLNPDNVLDGQNANTNIVISNENVKENSFTIADEKLTGTQTYTRVTINSVTLDGQNISFRIVQG